MAVRTCKVTCRDAAGIEHTVEVSAQSVFEAVAQALGSSVSMNGAISRLPLKPPLKCCFQRDNFSKRAGLSEVS